MSDGLTIEEHMLFSELVNTWAKRLSKNQARMRHYEGKVDVAALDLGISIPPPIVRKLGRCSMMWCKQAVSRIADTSVIDGYRFRDGIPSGFAEVWEANEIADQYDETMPSTAVHGLSMWTVTKGMDGEQDVVVSSYDAEHAAALYDYRHRRTLAGLTVVDVDYRDPKRITAANLFLPNGDIVQMEQNARGQWTMKRCRYGTGRCMMEVMRNDPDKQHPFGKSAITPAIMTLENEANREAVRMVMHAELYTAPTRWVMGAPDDIFDNNRWEAYLGSIFALSKDSDGDTPSTGSYPVGDFTPHVSYIRQLANQFASEASIPIHSLLYTEANPASADAIEASRNDLIEKVTKVNRINARSLERIGKLVLSLLEETPVAKLGENEQSLKVDFINPRHATPAQMADEATKTVADVPEFASTRYYWKMKGYRDDEIDAIMSDISRSGAISALNTISAAMRSEG